MVDEHNKYSKMQQLFYDTHVANMIAGNHKEHNDNPDYWNILLGNLNDITGKEVALDFGCGCGRNVYNLLKNWNWKRVDGVDISQKNIEATKKYLIENKIDEDKYSLYKNNGVDLSLLKSEEYDFVMSTIVFQHIAVHEIRYNLMTEIHRVLKDGGVFSFQMGFGKNDKFKTVDYYENYYDAKGTNSDCDVRVENPEYLVTDLQKIGFKNIDYNIRPSWSNIIHTEWIFIKAYK